MMICELDKHVWVQGAEVKTYGETPVTYCGVCGLVKPSGGGVYLGVIQTTLDGWTTLLAAPVSAEGVS